MNRQKLSATIITLNEADNIRCCIDSLQFANEVIVVDSGSSDGTQQIAEKAGAKVIDQTWLGYGQQKQFALQQARYDWVLCIDADERVSLALGDEIQQVLQAPQYQVYDMPRRNIFLGRWLAHGEGYPDRSLRLLHRAYAQWEPLAIHEKVITKERVGQLQQDLLHHSQDSLDNYLQKQNNYTSLQAESMFKRGKQARLSQLILSPIFRFIKFYFFRLGFLDGRAGLIHILIGCFNSFNKYAKLYEKQQNKAKNSR